MSYITEVLIHGAERDVIEPLNAWLHAIDDSEQEFSEINMDSAGGWKVYASPVWAAAFNYMPVELLAKLQDPATWGMHVRSVAVIVGREETVKVFCFHGS